MTLCPNQYRDLNQKISIRKLPEKKREKVQRIRVIWSTFIRWGGMAQFVAFIWLKRSQLENYRPEKAMLPPT
jgi:hypothetical protein